MWDRESNYVAGKRSCSIMQAVMCVCCKVGGGGVVGIQHIGILGLNAAV